MITLINREKSSQSLNLFKTLRDEWGPQKTCFMGYGEKNRRFVSLQIKESK